MSDIKFYNLNHLPPRVPHVKFRKVIPNYEMTIDKNGHKVLKALPIERGRNIYDIIQAELPGTGIYDIIARFKAGDKEAILPVNWKDADYTAVTGTLIDMQNKLDKAENFFETAPVDFRKKYDFSFEKFLAAVDRGDFFKTDKTETAQTEPAQTEPAQTQVQGGVDNGQITAK